MRVADLLFGAMDRKSFIKSVAAGGVFAALSPLSVAECGEKNPPFAKFDM